MKSTHFSARWLLVALGWTALMGCGGRVPSPLDEGSYLYMEYGTPCTTTQDAHGHNVYSFCVIPQGNSWAGTLCNGKCDAQLIVCSYPYADFSCVAQ